MAITTWIAGNRLGWWQSALACLFFAAPLQADTSSLMSMFRKKPATAQELELKAEHGPWLILAATLPGEDAQVRATKLANEMRAKLKVPAFVMHKDSEQSEVLGVGERIVTDRNGRQIPKQINKKYANGVGTEAYAVLVGEFSSTDDPRVKEILEAIRVAQPETLGASGKPEKEGEQDEDSAWLVRKTREFIWKRSSRNENLKKGPMGAAFVTRNPLLPDDFFETPKVDDFVAKLNKQVKHSLLDCPGRFTVRVASFRGYAITAVGNEESSGLPKASTELDRAAEQANKLTMALRAKGTEAYQFHDRYGSYVMIGSFDEIGKVVDGAFRYNPAMVAIVQEYCGYRVLDVKDPRTGAISRNTSLKSLEKIPFDIEGKPMAVPRPESKSLYNGSLLGSR